MKARILVDLSSEGEYQIPNDHQIRTIGRDGSSYIAINTKIPNSGSVSKNHAEIICESDGSVYIINKGRHGTIIERTDGEKIPVNNKEQLFENDSIILAGAYSFKLEYRDLESEKTKERRLRTGDTDPDLELRLEES